MARGADGSVRLLVSIREYSTGLGVGGETSRLMHPIDVSLELPSGTSNGSIDRVYSSSASATTTPTDVDLSGGLTSPLDGSAVSFAEVAVILIQNTAAAGNLLVGGDAASIPLFSNVNDVLVLPPGAWVALSCGPAGLAVTADTGDILQIASSSGTVTYKLEIAGRST